MLRAGGVRTEAESGETAASRVLTSPNRASGVSATVEKDELPDPSVRNLGRLMLEKLLSMPWRNAREWWAVPPPGVQMAGDDKARLRRNWGYSKPSDGPLEEEGRVVKLRDSTPVTELRLFGVRAPLSPAPGKLK